MDRIDVHIAVRRVSPEAVLATGKGTSSATLRHDVLRAREYASWRREQAGIKGRHETSEELVQACHLGEKDADFFEETARVAHMSGRAIMRTLSLARTVADMEQRLRVERGDLCEALGFRLRDDNV